MTEPRSQVRVRKEILLLAADIIACTATLWLALMIRFRGVIPIPHQIPYLTFWPVLAGIRILTAQGFGLYDFRRRLTLADHLFGAIGATLCGVAPGYLFLAFVRLYYMPTVDLSRLMAMIDLGLVCVWFALSRTLVLAGLLRCGYRVRLLLTGPQALCRSLLAEIRDHLPKAVELLGIACTDEDGGKGDDCLGSATVLRALIMDHRVDQIILAGVDNSQEQLRDLLAHCGPTGAQVFLYPTLNAAVFARPRLTSIAGLPLVSLDPFPQTGLYGMGKRAFDIVASACLLILSLPVWAFAAIAIPLGSRGPILFSQERIGLHGVPFRLLKFRTMIADAEAESGPTLSPAQDPRVTPIGRVLRRWRIDEIPQFWNVLRGEMSLVGPRPERPSFVEAFIRENPLYERRHLVRPGLTGLAQIHGRYDTEYTHKLRYDLVYLNTLSFSEDLRILLATIRTVMTGKGAL